MSYTLIVLLFINLSHGFVVKENVIFHKVHDIFLTNGHWLVSFVHELQPYAMFVDKIKGHIELTDTVLKSQIQYYHMSNLTGYAATFQSLQLEIGLLNNSYQNVKDSFADYQTMHSDRTKRSLLPIVGQAMSVLFGVVTETDLENINRNIKTLAENQKQIIHDLKETVSVVRLNQEHISENRRAIIDLIVTIQRLDNKIAKLREVFERKFIRLEQFIHAYIQFQLIMDEINLMSQNAVKYLENLKSELNLLSLNHLSISTISPKNLKQLLLEIETKLPLNLGLPEDPRANIWYYYNTLHCMTYLEENEVRIVLNIPLISIVEKYEIYKIHSLPVPMKNHTYVSKEINKHYLAEYNLESTTIMISTDKTKYALLKEHTYLSCVNPYIRHCNVKSAIYQVNLSKLCVIALFMGYKDNSKRFCTSKVRVDKNLPMAKYISHGIWIVTLNISLDFTYMCRYKKDTETIRIKPTFGIIQLNNTCTATSKYLTLPEYYENHNSVKVKDAMESLLLLSKLSEFKIWHSFKAMIADENMSPVEMPPSLLGMNEIPMTQFINMHKYRKVVVQNKRSYWVIVLIIVTAVLIMTALGYMIMKHRNKVCKPWLIGGHGDTGVTQTSIDEEEGNFGEVPESVSQDKASGDDHDVIRGQEKPPAPMIMRSLFTPGGNSPE